MTKRKWLQIIDNVQFLCYVISYVVVEYIVHVWMHLHNLAMGMHKLTSRPHYCLHVV